MVEKDEIKKLAELSRIEVGEEELGDLSADIESILEYVGELKEIAIEDPESESGVLRNIMREDGDPHESGQYTKDMLAQAPEREGDYFKVKKILS